MTIRTYTEGPIWWATKAQRRVTELVRKYEKNNLWATAWVEKEDDGWHVVVEYETRDPKAKG